MDITKLIEIYAKAKCVLSDIEYDEKRMREMIEELEKLIDGGVENV